MDGEKGYTWQMDRMSTVAKEVIGYWLSCCMI